MSALKKKRGRILYIDMDEIHIPSHTFLNANKKAWLKEQQLKRLDPFALSMRQMQYKSPEDLQRHIDDYFNSCFGPLYYKGEPLLDIHGKTVIGQTQPFTLSGLARHLHISTVTLYNYEAHAKAGLIPSEYADVIIDAKLRIQEYAEKRLYDRDGTNGAKFVLEAGFGWMTKREKQELKQNKKRIKAVQDKVKLLKEAAAANKLDDNQFVVNILRAGDDDDNK